MWPIMFATSFHPSMNALPLFPGKSVDWIPVDVAAATITDILLSPASPENGECERLEKEEGKYSVHNIVNPRPIPWAELVGMLQDTHKGTEKKMEEIAMTKWTRRLGALPSSTTDPKSVPGLRLLQFFEDMAVSEEEEGESKVFETGKTQGISGALRSCEAFNRRWLEGNVRVWRESGFLSSV